MKSIPPEELESIEQRLFESLAGDEPPKRAHRAAAVALGLSATLTTATITGATAGAAGASSAGAVSSVAAKASIAAKASTMLLVKWVGVGTLAGAVSVGAMGYARHSWQEAKVKPAVTLSSGAKQAPIGAPAARLESATAVVAPQAPVNEQAPIAEPVIAEPRALVAEPEVETLPRVAQRVAPLERAASASRGSAARGPIAKEPVAREPIAKEPAAKEAAREPIDDTPTFRAPPASMLAAEVAVLDDARRAIAGRDGERALGLLRRHAREFPAATLNIEATVLRIEALLLAGSTAAARDLGRNFLAAYPTSTHATRVRHLLADYEKP